jgi:hypothetical protein
MQPKKNNNKNLGKVVYLALVSLFNFTAMTSVGGSISYMADQNGYTNLGNISLLINNFSAAICTFIAPTVIKRLKYHQLFTLSCLTVLFFVCQGLFMSSCSTKTSHFFCSDSFIYSITVVGSLIFGFGSPLYSVGSAMYISENTSLTN